jgi:hypothetical protein
MCAAVLLFIPKADDNLPLTDPMIELAAALASSPPTITELLVLPAPE